MSDALAGLPVTSMTAWLDSSVALHWILKGGDFKQFVGNRIRKIKEREAVEWRHVLSVENPGDLASRGGLVTKENTLWWKGPTWLSDPLQWPPRIVTKVPQEAAAEMKPMKQVFALAKEEHDEMDTLLFRSSLWRVLRIGAWINRFLYNASHRAGERLRGPLTTLEVQRQKKCWEKRVQGRVEGINTFEEDGQRLDLQSNADGVLECRGRIQDHDPLYLPDKSIYAKKIVEEAHLATLHGGVSLTMTNVRGQYWIPEDRTEGTTPFQVIGIDYAGPLTSKVSKKKQGKAYLLLYSCSLTRAIHLEQLPILETQDFIRSLLTNLLSKMN